MAALSRGTLARGCRFKYTNDLLARFCRCSSTQAPSTSDNLPRKSREFRKLKSQVSKQNRQDPQLERASRLGRLSVDLNTVHQEWKSRHGATNVRNLARHSGVFDHVFDGIEFYPSIMMNIKYKNGNSVHCGNFITSSEALVQPDVDYPSEDSTMWTLLLTNPDGNIWEKDSELLHWMVCNIRGSRVSDGAELCSYLPPLPPQGTGHHRYVFSLLQQKAELDLAEYGIPQSSSIASRFFSTAKLLHRLGDKVTPAGLAFFQASWDDSVSNTYTDTLGISEPMYRLKPFHTPSTKRRNSTQDIFASKYKNM